MPAEAWVTLAITALIIAAAALGLLRVIFHLRAVRQTLGTVIVGVWVVAHQTRTVPAALAPTKPGDYFDARFDPEEDAIVFRRLGGQESWLTVMKECPVSPDDVPSRRRAPAKRRTL